MPRTGRPPADIDKNQFEQLCAMQCTEEEICAWFNVTDKPLNAWCRKNYKGKTFSEVFKIKRKKGWISLRRSQFQMAEHNPTMAIFLGKQYLGQKDHPEQYDNEEVEDDGFIAALTSSVDDTMIDDSDLLPAEGPDEARRI